MSRPFSHAVTAAGLVVTAVSASGCVEVYMPRPSSAVVVTGNGGSGYRVFKDGEDLGGESAVRVAVEGDPRAESEAAKASSSRAGATVTNLAGAVAWGVGWAMLATDAGDNSSQFPTALGDAAIGLIVGGAALYIIGGVLSANAHTHMFNAVNLYNDDIVPRDLPHHRAGPESAPPGSVYLPPGPGYAPQPVYPAPAGQPPLPPLLPPLPPPPPPAPAAAPTL